MLLLGFLLAVLSFGFLSTGIKAQPLYQVEIWRDSFGVPHIYGKTDPDAAYGLAWAHSEDAFAQIQENLLAGRGVLASIKGKKGALMDFALRFYQLDSLVEQRYERDLSPDFKQVLEAYVQGLNDYAKANPKEVLRPKLLPFTGKDIIKNYCLVGVLMSGGAMGLMAAHRGRLEEIFAVNDFGSNAWVLAPHRTSDNRTWLASNSHQPIEGPFAWYEAHINSEAGWNIIGGLFPGGVSAFIGTTPDLSWSHTVNYHNFLDIFELKTKGRRFYEINGRWQAFEQSRTSLKIRVLGGLLRLPVRKRLRQSAFGPVYRRRGKYYAFRHGAAKDIRSAEQWYRMNRAKNFEEFDQALRMQALPLFNVIYGDTSGNIFLASEGQIPKRDSSYGWRIPIMGRDSGQLWEDLLSYEAKPQILNPKAGYLFNANGTPLRATDKAEDLRLDFKGLQRFSNNRHERLGNLLAGFDGKTLAWSDFLAIKYDKAYEAEGIYAKKFKPLYELDTSIYPRLAKAWLILSNWNKAALGTDTSGAALALMTHHFLAKRAKLPFGFLMIREAGISSQEAVWALRRAQRYLRRRYGSLQPSLSQVQFLIRGKQRLGIGGMGQVLRAVDSRYERSCRCMRMYAGDGYMQLVRMDSRGVELETVLPYGASHKPKSPYYNDQMSLFVGEQTRPMYHSRERVWGQTLYVYRPGQAWQLKALVK